MLDNVGETIENEKLVSYFNDFRKIFFHIKSNLICDFLKMLNKEVSLNCSSILSFHCFYPCMINNVLKAIKISSFQEMFIYAYRKIPVQITIKVYKSSFIGHQLICSYKTLIYGIISSKFVENGQKCESKQFKTIE